ncbi:hypothetical protein AAC387_Pa12g0911 [Persea americana]
MEIGFGGDEKVGLFTRCMRWVEAFFLCAIESIAGVPKKVKKIGQDDPRRIIHSFKVGFALSLVSLFYYCRPLFGGFGTSAMWAVMTVVVVFEYTVGATLGKGLNRAFATLLAGALGVGAHHLASLSGKREEPIILGAFVFLIAVSSTFARFFPGIKARYDYGVLIFILTFSLVTVSGYRVNDLVEMAHQRLSTIAIGSSTCVFISIFVCPVWAGEELQEQVALNIEKLAKFLEGFGAECFNKEEEREKADVAKVDKSFLQAYKSILNSKSSEEALANLARWEPGHGRFRFRHPWDHYLKIGALACQCACSMDALYSCISSKIQTPVEFQERIKDACTKMSSESGKALTELALAIRIMMKPVAAAAHVASAKTAAANLKATLKITSSEITVILEILPAATIASVLVEIVAQTEKLAEAVDELGRKAKFKNPATVTERMPSFHRIKPLSDDVHGPHVLITVLGSNSDSPENAGLREPRKYGHVDM